MRLLQKKLLLTKYFPNNLSQIKHLMPRPGIYYKIYGIVQTSSNKKLDQFIELILNKLDINNKKES